MKIILIVEDTQLEIDTAKQAVATISDCNALYAQNLQDAKRLFNQLQSNLFGVVTDLHFQSMTNNDSDIDRPNGLALVALCVEKNIRVAVCSDINHHFSHYVREPLRVLATHQSYSYKCIPVSEDKKDWITSLHNLLNLES